MAYFQATGWAPMNPAPAAPPGPDPITSFVTSITDWLNSKAPPASPPPPSTSTMMTVASNVAAPPPKPAAPPAPKPASGLGLPIKLAIGAGALGLIYLVVR